MTFAACETETVGPPVMVTAAEAPSEALTFGSLAFDSLPGVADPLDGVTGALLGGETSSIAELGGTRAADGGTEPTDAVAEALAVSGADVLGGDFVTVLCVATVEVTDGASDVGGAMTRGAGDSTFVTVGFTAVVGDAGATAVTTGAVVDCVTGGSTACCVCGGDSMLGAAGSGAGAFGGGASWDGPSTSSGACTSAFGSGAGAVVVTT